MSIRKLKKMSLRRFKKGASRIDSWFGSIGSKRVFRHFVPAEGYGTYITRDNRGATLIELEM